MSSADTQLGSEAHHVLKAVVAAFTDATKEVNKHYTNPNAKHPQQHTGEQLHQMRKYFGGRRCTPLEFTDAQEVLFVDEAGKASPQNVIARSMLMSAAQKLDRGNGVDVNEFYCSVILFCNEPIDLKLQIAFDCFDLNSDGYISREEMEQFLRWLLDGTLSILRDASTNPAGYAMPESSMKPIKDNMPAFEKIFHPARIPDMVKAAFEVADTDGDNLISCDEWQAWTSKGGLAAQWGILGDLFN